VTSRIWAPVLGLLACGACAWLVEDNPQFAAGGESTSSESEEDEGQDETDTSPMNDDEIPNSEPPRPAWLTVYTLGNPEDADVVPLGPGLLLVGGGIPGDVPYQWQANMIAGGDIVILQSTSVPLLDDYLYGNIGGADSVQTVVVPAGAASHEPWIAWTLAHAEAVVIIGDDPYAMLWKNTPIEAGIMAAWDRGAVIAGVDAGLSSLGEFVYPGYGELLSSDEALADPYGEHVALERNYLSLDLLEDTLIEPRFANQDRMGRLLAFGARVLQDGWSNRFVGLGINEDAAMVIGPDGVGEVSGSGYVYVFRTQQRPATCVPGQPLEFGPVTVVRLAAGDTATWPDGATNLSGSQVIATAGSTEPEDPY
jgi:cyanophycinase